MYGRTAAFPAHASVTYIGHATVLIEMSGTKILTDPVFRRRVWLLKRCREAYPTGLDLTTIDAVFLSHMHFDHMDYPSLRMIPKSVPIVAPEGASHYLRRKVSHEVHEMREGESVRVGEVEVCATHSLHDTGFYWPFWLQAGVLSYMFQGSKTVYFIGDTALFEKMGELGESYDIDLALLPVWGFGPYIRGDHLSPGEAACAVSLLSPRMAIPIHWGTFHPLGPMWKKMSFMADPPRDFAAQASRFAPGTDVLVLSPGESTLLC